MDLAEARARLDGEYLAALGELASRNGAQGAAHVLREMNRMTTMAARSDARLALGLKEHDYTDTVEALRGGEINVGHARVIAREAPKKHRRSEDSFLDMSRQYPADVVAKHPFAYESNQMYADLEAEQAAKSREPADAEYALQRAERKTTLNVGADGMWHLRGKFDFITGRRINQALTAAVRSRKQLEGSADHTQAQHAADALADLVCGNPARRDRPNTQLLILADYDHTNKSLGNPRLDDGTPLSAELLAQEALNADVYCAVFDADWANLALGRSRDASHAQRLILNARDGGCAHCGTHTEHTHAHHRKPHAAGGETTIGNLQLLCPPCHTHHHQTEEHPGHRPPEPGSGGSDKDAETSQPASRHSTQHQNRRPHQPKPLNPVARVLGVTRSISARRHHPYQPQPPEPPTAEAVLVTMPAPEGGGGGGGVPFSEAAGAPPAPSPGQDREPATGQLARAAFRAAAASCWACSELSISPAKPKKPWNMPS